MTSRRALARMLAAPDEWNRRKLQALVGIASLVGVAVLVGAVWAVGDLLSGDGREAGATATPEQIDFVGPNDLTLDGAQPGELSEQTTGSVFVPQPRSLGAALVPTGFPRTSQGAMAQLIAIDQRAIQSVSLVTAQEVIAGWAAPGGPTAESWSGIDAVRTLLESAGLASSGSTELVVQLEPAMGLLQDDDAPGQATPCVDFVLAVTAQGGRPSRIAVADCQHMVWQGGRWVIGPGQEPEPPASLWPGTQASYDAGYQWLEVSP